MLFAPRLITISGVDEQARCHYLMLAWARWSRCRGGCGAAGCARRRRVVGLGLDQVQDNFFYVRLDLRGRTPSEVNLLNRLLQSCISLLRHHGVPSLERLAHSEEVILQRGVLEWLVTVGILAQSCERLIPVLRFGQVA